MTTTEDYYLAGFLAYAGYPLVEIRTEGRSTTFVFDMNSWSYDELAEAYHSSEAQPITVVKAYATSLQRLTALQKKARLSRDGLWVSRTWTTGGKEADAA